MRMRVAGSHHGAAILENLDVVNIRTHTQFLELARPGPHHFGDVLRIHGGERQVVARGETHDSARAGFPGGNKESFSVNIEAIGDGVRLQGREVIVEDKSALVDGVVDASGPGISRAQVASRVIFRLPFDGNFLYGTLPGPQSAVRGHQYPFAGEGIESSVRVLGQLQTRPS